MRLFNYLHSRVRKVSSEKTRRRRRSLRDRLLTRLGFEGLESRRLLATITWNGSGDGSTWTSGTTGLAGSPPE